jgi:serine/threonine-protein kinase
LGTNLKGRYHVTRLVAGGGMAWVYEVEEHRADGSRVVWAMKELRVDADDTHTLAESRAMFAQEANILVALDHPNLPQVSAFFDEQGRSYLIMEFIHGESLEKRLERANAPLLESQVLDWAVQVCDVLSYLHGQPQPVIFRDLKPSNVMVTLEGRVKLIDFGIARTFKSGKSRDTVTMGSENYAAPEQWGQAQTDARADIYGLGATMYHLLTNVPPLPAFVPTPRVPVAQYNAAVSDATVALIERAMSTDRTGRYPTAAAMRAACSTACPGVTAGAWSSARRR